MFTSNPRVYLVGFTSVDYDELKRAYPEYDADNGIADGDVLAEVAGRLCYESFNRPNPATASNDDYLAHIREVGHTSTFEHNTYTFVIKGVSRTLTHELVRHRHQSPSQQSQRYVDASNSNLVLPPEFLELLADEVQQVLVCDTQGDDAASGHALADRMMALHQDSLELYSDIVEYMTGRGVDRKAARGAARSVLLAGTETHLMLSGNIRAWRNFIALRAHPAADIEIRTLAELIRDRLIDEVPGMMGDLLDEGADQIPDEMSIDEWIGNVFASLLGATE